MCGIAGFIHFDKERLAGKGVIKRMTDIISHRGPDGDGFYINQNIALGHRRLAIIDLATGKQPMCSNDNEVVVTFNGEIYNYIELKRELENLGHHFTTTSDTEVIINAYRQWGEDCQNHFNGMWAFALWDDKEERLFISRDRIGEKPLYYAIFDDTFIFASEIKAIIKYGMPAEPRLEMLELYTTMSFIPAPYTFYKNVHQLLPGNFILVNSDGFKIHTYWQLPNINESQLTKDKKKVEDQFESLFEDSVNIRMRSDVSFGAFLSGGLDSSCVVATMSKYTKAPVETFTIGFDHNEFDEVELAKKVADKFGCNHHLEKVTPASLDEALEKVIFHYDEPFGDPSAIPVGRVSQFAAKYVKMVLTGDGGDEVLSGYTSYQGEKFAQHYLRLPTLFRKALPGLINKAAFSFRGNIRYKLNRVVKVLEASNQPFQKRLLAKLCKTSVDDVNELLAGQTNMISFNDYYESVMSNCSFNDSFYKLMHFQLKVTLPFNMLTKVDRMSMAYSIETRVPFLDHRIIELLYGVDKQLKMSGYLNKTILRNTVANKSLPKQLLKAPKKGFDVPLRDWFKDDALGSKVNKLITTHDELYDRELLSRLLAENKNGESDRGSFIWQTIVFSKWLNQLKAPIKQNGTLNKVFEV